MKKTKSELIEMVDKTYRSVPKEVIDNLRDAFSKWSDPNTLEWEKYGLEKGIGEFILNLHEQGYYTEMFSRAYLAILDILYNKGYATSTSKSYEEFIGENWGDDWCD